MVDKRISRLSLCHLLLHTDCLSADKVDPPCGPSQGWQIISLGVSKRLDKFMKIIADGSHTSPIKHMKLMS